MIESGLTSTPRKTSRWRRWAKAALSAAVILLILFFIVRVMINNWDQTQEAIRKGTLKFQWVSLGVSFLFLGVALVSRSLLWHLITLRNGVALLVKDSMACWFISLLGKYIPGKVFLLAGRMYLYKHYGKDPATVAFCYLLEATCELVAAACILILSLFLLNLPLGDLSREQAALAAGGVLAALLIFLHPRVVGWMLGKTFRIIGGMKSPVNLPCQADLLLFVLCAMCSWLLLGTGFFFMTDSIYSVSPGLLPFLSVSFSLATVAGILSIFAPSGIGVREGALYSLIKFTIPPGIASLVVLISRVWMTMGELILSFLALFLLGYRRRNPITAPSARETSP